MSRTVTISSPLPWHSQAHLFNFPHILTNMYCGIYTYTSTHTNIHTQIPLPIKHISSPRFFVKTSQSTNRLAMGWLRWVGSLKIWVFFAEYGLFYRALLQKRPTIWRSLLIVATPYMPARPCQVLIFFGVPISTLEKRVVKSRKN